METIKTYLDNMFLNLPNTEDVERAKQELLQMMEDKYTELKEAGKTENEAVGIVISEFGNLEDIADSLGISDVLKKGKAGVADADETPEKEEDSKMLTLEEAEKFLKAKAKSAVLVALGVMLCICSLIGAVIADGIGSEAESDFMIYDAMGAIWFFVFIAIAVALFIISGIMMKEYEWIKKGSFVTNYATKAYIEEARKAYRLKYGIFTAIGVMLCILCMVPGIAAEGLDEGVVHFEMAAGVGMFLLVGVGVYFILRANIVEGGFDTLLKRRKGRKGVKSVDSRDASSEYKNIADEIQEYKSPAYADMMSLYWPTVSCIYVCWSFLTFDWHITWIIWPIASIVYKLLDVYGR